VPRRQLRFSALLVGVAFVVAAGLGGCTSPDGPAGSPGPGAPNPTFSAAGPCDLAFGSSCGPPPTPAGSASPGRRDVSGQWKGTYTCGQGLTGFNLDISDEGGGAVSAVFSFGPVESNPGVPNGSYSMTGRRDPRSLTLTPNAWIEKPPGYVMVGLVAELQGKDPDVLSGTVTNSACTTFRVTR
jgi:hypothetical protein